MFIEFLDLGSSLQGAKALVRRLSADIGRVRRQTVVSRESIKLVSGALAELQESCSGAALLVASSQRRAARWSDFLRGFLSKWRQSRAAAAGSMDRQVSEVVLGFPRRRESRKF